MLTLISIVLHEDSFIDISDEELDEVVNINNDWVDEPIDQGVDIACQMCLMVAAIASKYLNPETTKEQLITFLEKVCYVVPEILRGACEGMMKQHGQQIYQLILQHKDFASICTTVGACNFM